MGVNICAGCGSKVNSAWTICPECGADPRSGHAAQLNADADRVNFPRSQYLGGLPWLPQPLRGDLVFTQQSLELTCPTPALILWMADVERIELLTSAQAEDRVSGAERAGLVALGALTLGIGAAAVAVVATAPDRFNRVTFAIHASRDGQTFAALLAVNDLYPSRFRDRLGPLLEAVGVPLSEGAAPPPPQAPQSGLA